MTEEPKQREEVYISRPPPHSKLFTLLLSFSLFLSFCPSPHHSLSPSLFYLSLSLFLSVCLSFSLEGVSLTQSEMKHKHPFFSLSALYSTVNEQLSDRPPYTDREGERERETG